MPPPSPACGQGSAPCCASSTRRPATQSSLCFGPIWPRNASHGLTSFATLLAERGALKADLTIDKARDLIWTLCAQANYDALVTTRRWSHTEYREWLAETLAAALLATET